MTLKFEVAGYIKRAYVGMGYGIYQRPNSEENGLENVKSSVGHFSINLGYNVMNKRVILTPQIGYFSYRNRVKSKEDNDSLNDYLNNNGLDLKFVGYFAKAGIDLHFVVSESFDHHFIGVRANYLHQFGGTVIKNNFGDKLSSPSNINFDKFNFEIVFTIFND